MTGATDEGAIYMSSHEQATATALILRTPHAQRAAFIGSIAV